MTRQNTEDEDSVALALKVVIAIVAATLVATTLVAAVLVRGLGFLS